MNNSTQEYPVTTLLEQDISDISQAILSIMGVSIDELQSEKRMVIDRYPAKVAFCHFLYARGHAPATIAKCLGGSLGNVYRLLRQHEDMIYGDVLYKRSVDVLNHYLKK